ncbi:amino acid adenylation domain-containing protein [Actinokineospora sp. 24-640]
MSQARLRALWGEALELSGEWSPEATFFELGGYSLLALSVADRLRAEFGVDAPRTVVFEHPTFQALSEWLAAASVELSTKDSGGGVERTLSPLQQAYVLGETGGFDLASPAVFVEDYACADLDVPALRSAVLALMERHEMLRARFRADGTYRVADVPAEAPLAVRDLSAWPAEEVDAELAAVRAGLVASPPELESGTAWEFRVFRVPAGYRVVVCGRLLAFDGRSGDIVADELRTLLSGGSLPPVEYGFGEYRAAVSALREGAEHAAAREHWRPRLATLPPAPDLPRAPESRAPESGHTDPGHTDPGHTGLRRRTAVLDEPRWAAFKAQAGAHGVTTTVALCAAFAEVLRHFSAEADFTVNVMYGERRPTHPAVSDVVGNFSDTLLLECRSDPSATFAERAAALGARLVADLAHGAFSGVEAIRELNQRHGNTLGAAMPVVFASVVGGRSQDGIFLERLGWTRVVGEIHTPQVSFDHQVFDSRDTLVANWDTADALFPPGLVDAMFEGYRALLDRLSADPAAWLRTAFDLTPRAQLDLRDRVNDTAADLPVTTLHGPVFAQAARTPDAVAVISPDRVLTYRDLAALAGGVAAQLAGCAPGEPVLVRQDRGWRQVVALLGVLAAGGAYVPIARDWPAGRVAAVQAKVGARHVVGEPVDGCRQITVDSPGEPPDVPEDPDALAYVLFTSGTTGEPKGVALRHRAAANTVADVNRRYGVGPADRVLGISEVTFDLSVYDVFGPLATGGALVTVAEDAARDAAALHALVAEHGVTVWNSVPAYLGMLLDYRAAAPRPALPSLRLALVSGDWVPVTLGGALAGDLPGVGLVSLGGATEAAIWSNHHPVGSAPLPGWASVPYGLPLANQSFRVLDDALADRPDWVPGDLHIGGVGLAEGYHADPALTAAAFIERCGERLYRTGDRGRYRPDGLLEFLGRRDSQVKVNGFRVELGEVDAALLAQPGVRAAGAVLSADDRGGSLVAHIVADDDTDDETIQAGLRERLPGYLIPRALIRHDALPLTGNGKVDRAKLRQVRPETGGTVAAPVSSVEERLLVLWRGVVDVPGVTDDFFAAGGHSLAAAALMNAVEGEFGVRLPLGALYERRTVRDLAPLLAEQVPAGPALVRFGGDGDPVVFVHPVGGDVFCYAPLAAALDGFRVFAIAADPGPTGEPTLPELAKQYLDLAESVTGEAPLRLAGWSFGAVLAYEMARQARENGRECAVVLLDPWLPRTPGAEVAEDVLRASFAHNLSQGRSTDASVVPGLTETTISQLYARYRGAMRALLGHRFRADPGLRPLLVTAGEGLGRGGADFLVPLDLPDAHRVDGDHFAVVDPARAAELAALIRQGLR